MATNTMRKIRIAIFGVFIVFLFLLPTSVYSQFSNTDDSWYLDFTRRWAEKMGKSWIGLRSVEKIGAITVKERYPNGIPKKVGFFFWAGYHIGGKWSDVTNDNYSELVFDERLPIAFFPGGEMQRNDYRCFTEFPFRPDGERRFTDAEEEKMRSSYVKFRRDMRERNQMYRDVANRLNAYPKENDIKNCLATVYQKQNAMRINYTDNPDYGQIPGASRDRSSLEFAGSMKVKMYKNISNHTIVIKGIWQRHTINGDEYYDQSIKMEPGQITDYFKIYREFDDYCNFDVQYIGNPGIIKDIK